MKTHRILLLTALLALPGLLPAQTVPEFISYQGRVLDSAGAAVGTGTPVNRTVIFRVWDHQSNTLTGNLIYSEQQTVTIADGKFSVLVGQGVATTGTPFSYSETSKGPPTVSIANAFNGSGRYLGVTVDDGTAAVDNEIAPRQQVVSSAFAFRSKFAETLNGGTITGTVTATGGTFTGGTFTGGTFSGTGSNLTALNATSLSSGTVNDARLSSNVALLNRSPQTFTGATNIFNGGVGIGTAAPQTRLHVNGGDLRVDSGSNVAGAGGAINFGYADTGTAPPMAMVKGLLSNSRGDGLQGGLAFYIRPYATTATNLTECLRISDSGNVGIGTSNPNDRLVVSGGNIRLVPSAAGVSDAFILSNNLGTVRGHLGYAAAAGAFSTHAAADDIILRADSGKLLLQSGIGASAIAIDNFRNVGFGTTLPEARIHLMHNSGWPWSILVDNAANVTNNRGGIRLGDAGFFEFTNNARAANPNYARLDSTGAWGQVSDLRRKKDITSLTGLLQGALNLRPVRYHFKDAAPGDPLQIGFIAQEVREQFPTLVSDGDGLTLNYSGLSVVAIGAIKELHEVVRKQDARISTLEQQLAQQAKDLAALKAKDEARDTKLAAIEKLLQGTDKPVVRTVSLKSAE